MKAWLGKPYLENCGESDTKSDSKSGSPPAIQELMTMDSLGVWACLNDCDVYTAAKIVLLADVLRETSPSSHSPLTRYININLLQEVIDRTRDDFAMTSNLVPTVLEDCYLLLLVPESSRNNKVKALCSLGLLTGKSNEDLLKCFLQSAEISLENLAISQNNSNPSSKLLITSNVYKKFC